MLTTSIDLELFLAFSSSTDVDFQSVSPRESPEILAARWWWPPWRLRVPERWRDSAEEKRWWSSSTMAFLMRSVSLEEPQGPLSRRASGTLSVSEKEEDLSKDVFFYKENERKQRHQLIASLWVRLGRKDKRREHLHPLGRGYENRVQWNRWATNIMTACIITMSVTRFEKQQNRQPV